MRQKIFTLLFAIAVGTGTLWASGIEVNDIWYDFDLVNQTATVTCPDRYSITKYSGSVVIPETVMHNYDIYNVIAIGDGAFDGCIDLYSVIIPNSVVNIGDDAFSGCSDLTSIVIPNSVISIGNNAFSYCSSLSTVTIGNGLTTIGDCAFVHDTSLVSINIPNSVTSIGNVPFNGCNHLPVIENCRYAGEYLVEAVDKSMSSCSIQEGTIWIGDGAFKNCNITSINFPNSVTYIQTMAFEECDSLTSINIPDGVLSIGSQAFWDCSI